MFFNEIIHPLLIWDPDPDSYLHIERNSFRRRKMNMHRHMRRHIHQNNCHRIHQNNCHYIPLSNCLHKTQRRLTYTSPSNYYTS